MVYLPTSVKTKLIFIPLGLDLLRYLFTSLGVSKLNFINELINHQNSYIFFSIYSNRQRSFSAHDGVEGEEDPVPILHENHLMEDGSDYSMNENKIKINDINGKILDRIGNMSLSQTYGETGNISGGLPEPFMLPLFSSSSFLLKVLFLFLGELFDIYNRI